MADVTTTTPTHKFSVHTAVRSTDIVLLTVPGDGLWDVVGKIGPALSEEAIVADLTAADPPRLIAAANMLGAGRTRFVDVAIMGAVSLHGIRTPLFASGRWPRTSPPA